MSFRVMEQNTYVYFILFHTCMLQMYSIRCTKYCCLGIKVLRSIHEEYIYVFRSTL